MDLQAIIGDYRAFLKKILQEVATEGFDLSDFVQLDHLCYRVASLEAYEIKKRELSTLGTLLGENQVSGRPIAVFRLRQSIIYEKWRVDTVELPAPRKGSPMKEGLEHIEFVLYDDMAEFLAKYAGKPFGMAAANRDVNPEVNLKLPSGYVVKFHLLSLPTVVYLQRKLGITNIAN